MEIHFVKMKQERKTESIIVTYEILDSKGAWLFDIDVPVSDFLFPERPKDFAEVSQKAYATLRSMLSDLMSQIEKHQSKESS